MTGYYQFKETAPASPQIPIIAYWDDYDKGPFALPHIYDYMEGQDAEHYSYPLMGEVYKRKALSHLLRENTKDKLWRCCCR